MAAAVAPNATRRKKGRFLLGLSSFGLVEAEKSFVFMGISLISVALLSTSSGRQDVWQAPHFTSRPDWLSSVARTR